MHNKKKKLYVIPNVITHTFFYEGVISQSGIHEGIDREDDPLFP